jgi:myo-inositol catabolism protein IolH
VKIALDPAMLNARPIDSALRAAVAAGFAYVELGNRDDLIPAFKPLTVQRGELAGIRRAAVASGLGIASVAVIQAWSNPDEVTRKQAVSWWRRGIEAAAELGSTRINSELTGDPNDPVRCRAAFQRSIEALLPDLEREGIDVAVEPHPGDFYETEAHALELIEAIGSPRVRYLHCLPHAYYLGDTVSEQIEAARGRIDHLHVADTYRPTRTIVNPAGLSARIHQHFDIGDGELDWDEVERALRSVGFDGIATVQVFGWDERAEESFRLGRAALERLLGSDGQTRP